MLINFLRQVYHFYYFRKTIDDGEPLRNLEEDYIHSFLTCETSNPEITIKTSKKFNLRAVREVTEFSCSTDVFSLADLFHKEVKDSHETYDSVPFYLIVISSFTYASSLYKPKQRIERLRIEDLFVPEE